jgi:hypothetical protein
MFIARRQTVRLNADDLHAPSSGVMPLIALEDCGLVPPSIKVE